MARLPRIVVPRYPHHIVQRGNRRLDVFFTDEDRLTYLDHIGTACPRYGVATGACCMMSNHVHFVAVFAEIDSPARCFSDAHVRYTKGRKRGQIYFSSLGLPRPRHSTRFSIFFSISSTNRELPVNCPRWSDSRISFHSIIRSKNGLSVMASPDYLMWIVGNDYL